MTYTKKERLQYNLYREDAIKKLGITKNQYNWFRREGEKLHQHYENNCNGLSTEKRYELVTRFLYNRIDRKAMELGLYVYYQTDPRGATIYLDTKPIPDNNYTQATCVY